MTRKLTRQQIRQQSRRIAKREMADRELTAADGITRRERRTDMHRRAKQIERRLFASEAQRLSAEVLPVVTAILDGKERVLA